MQLNGGWGRTLERVRRDFIGARRAAVLGFADICTDFVDSWDVQMETVVASTPGDTLSRSRQGGAERWFNAVEQCPSSGA